MDHDAIYVRRIQTSKLILFLSYFCAIAVTAAVIYGSYHELDVSSLTIIAPVIWAEVAVHTAVYSHKAKAENRLKILLSMIKELSQNDKFEPDVIVQLFEGVTREG